MVKIYAVKCDDFVRHSFFHAKQVLCEFGDRGHNYEVHDSEVCASYEDYLLQVRSWVLREARREYWERVHEYDSYDEDDYDTSLSSYYTD